MVEQSDDLDALLKELDESERDLSDGLGVAVPMPTDREGPPKASEEAATTPRGPAPCETACRAVGSMRRSAERICELTDQADSRCTGARQRVTRAEQQVERAGCACQ
jgi:hypothetical protein